MRLDELLDAASLPTTVEVVGSAASGVEVTSMSLDTRAVERGALFCAVAGSHVDGHDLVSGAVAAGAVALLLERRVDVGDRVPQVLVPSVRAAMGPIAAALHGHPSKALTVVGVTGTNGKTTTTHLLRSVFQASGEIADVIGTLTGAPGSPPTTPDAPELQARLAAMRDAGVTAVAMEVSSHGLAMQRVDGTRFAAVAFTNLSQDHLDVHGTMESYFAAKARLFDPSFTDRAVVNIDDPYGRLLLDAATVPTVGWSMAEASDVRLGVEGSTFRWRGAELHVPLAGRFNVANALCAAAVAAELGVGVDAVAAGLAAVERVRGRFEPVVAGQPFGVVVDYAHTPDALEQLLTAARELVAPEGHVLVVFGAGGDRDPAKRPRMGEIAARLADRVEVTSDNPRGEDPEAIVGEIVAGIADTSTISVETDRRRAIEQAITVAGPGDIVVIAGKGHETTQTIGDRVVPFDDAEIAREVLAGRGWTTP
jgi:UDP-N-acetylmuramoyl-L-alanyl-D-glutamate--2,6-diaminopimelate ligase